MYKIIGTDGRPYGPVGAEEIRRWIAENRVNAQTSAQTEGASDWKPACTTGELALALTSNKGWSLLHYLGPVLPATPTRR